MNTQQQEAGSRGWRIPSRSDVYNNSADISLFSTSLPVLQHEKLTFADSEHGGLFIDDATLGLNKLQLDVEDESSPGDVGANAIGSLLPGDEDELLAGIMDNFDLSDLRSQLEDMEEYDVFRSGGGMELDFDPQESVIIGVSNVNQSDSPENGSNEQGLPNGVGAIAGEHPLGEHPSRTLFVRNINSNVEESELRALFEQYGDIRTLYTACKHRGFVMISYYDIRAARTAMRALQNKPLRRRKLDIHFSIPKDNPSDKDVNQGTLVVFNLDPSVSNDELRNIFGAYGEVKEIRETPHKRHHKFIEFYDVRAAETALRSLNRRDIAGKRIKLEPSRPGGSRRNLVPQLTQELEQDETRSFQHKVGSPIANSPPGNWVNFSSSLEHNPLQAPSHSPIFGTSITRTNNHSTGLASIDSILPHLMSNPVKKAPISKDPGRFSHVGQLFGNTNLTFEHSYSFPDSTLSVFPVNMSSFGPSASRSSGTGMLSGHQFLWGSSPPYSEQSNSSSWSTLSTSHPFASNAHGQNVPYSTRCESFLGFADQHHVGSAPSGVSLDRHSSYFPASPETSFINKVTYGGMGLSSNEGNFLMNMGAPTSINGGLAFPGNVSENGSGSFGISPSQMLGSTFLGSSPYSGPGTNSSERLTERWRSRRIEHNGNSVDSTKQYQLDLDKIISGEDTRTTLMIKNIPNKYTSKMLLVCIDENNRGTYDFLYLPIDFKNKCNMGYAFINMVAPSHIISFYQAFNGKKWEKFNSEKVASLAYARIQGKAALVTHFQNSSLMNEDKRCRPILFLSEGVESGDQV